RRRPDRCAGGRADSCRVRGRDPPCADAAVRPRRHPATRRALQPRPLRRPDASHRRRDRHQRGIVGMLRRHNRLLITLHVISDAILGILMFLAAYGLRFYTPVTRLIPITKGTPPFQNYYLYLLPFVAALVPLAFQLQGLYRLRRGRSR